jgi:pimeloyl-ACP methyl ester carboxylesterase
MMKKALIAVATTAALIASPALARDTSGYAPIHGMQMYYEIHGAGEPLVLLHGAYSSIPDSFGALIPTLAEQHQVIAVELQGHGRTSDIDRPITYEGLADDVSALLDYLKVPQTDLYGYSMGAGVALQVAIRHPGQVRKLVLGSVSYNSAGMYPEVSAGVGEMKPEMFDNTPWKKDYDRLAPNKADFPKLVKQLSALDSTPYSWPAGELKAIKAPVLLILGDSDIIKPEHAVEMFRLFGGGVPGDLAGVPNSELAILPGATHVTEMKQTDLLKITVPAFLDRPIAKP